TGTTPDRRPSQPSPRWQRISLTAFREPGRHFFCELHLHPQLTDRGLVIPGLGPQPDQLGPLGLAQRGIRGYPRCRGLSCHLHPLAQSHLMDADVAGDLSDRTATVDDESYRLLLVLRRKCAACRTHFSLSRKIGQLSRVSTEAGTVQGMPTRASGPHPRLEPGPSATDPARVRDPPQSASASPLPARRRAAETATRAGRSRPVPHPTTHSRRWPDQRISPGRMTWTRIPARTGRRCDAGLPAPAPRPTYRRGSPGRPRPARHTAHAAAPRGLVPRPLAR